MASSFIECFNALEIPYSIVVFADYKYQYIIKNFEESHSEYISQRIFDCIMVERFKTRLADACYFIRNKVIHKLRENRAIFMISNGLDPKLKIGKEWINILNCDKSTFGFFFIEPNLENINKADSEFLKNIWKEFKTSSDSILVSVNENDILKCNLNLQTAFVSVFNSLNCEKKTELPSFQPILEEKYKLEELQIRKYECLSNNCEDIIFVQNNFHVQSKYKYKDNIQINSTFYPTKIEYTSEKEENNIKTIMSKILDSLENVQLNQINSFFPPNKPSMYAPSIKGTKFNIIGLINFCLTNGQYNKIYLDKIAGLKRDYRISVIIDSSLSCFNDIMLSHSFNTIITLLKLIYLLDIPYFDLIIATNSEPKVICCGVNSTNYLNNKSLIWEALISTLSENPINCNLLDAVKLVIKFKSQSTTKKNICFVLTDGLYDVNIINCLKDLINLIEERNVDIYGIGIGLYPKRLPKIFSKCIWCLNQKSLGQAFSVFLGNEIKCEKKIFKVDDESI